MSSTGSRQYISLARPVSRRAAPNLFDLRPGTITPLSDESGADSVNVRCEEWQLYPHLDATHTETLLHIDERGPTIDELAWPLSVRAQVCTAPVVRLGETDETGPTCARLDDAVISADALRKKLSDNRHAFVLFADMGEEPGVSECPAYLTHEAMALVVDRGIEHLLFSEFSVDRALDDGELHNHRLFWNVGADTTPRHQATITEQIAKPTNLEDGLYELVLTPLLVASDASLSTPLLLKE
jgi:kynurenine formamidase